MVEHWGFQSGDLILFSLVSVVHSRQRLGPMTLPHYITASYYKDAHIKFQQRMLQLRRIAPGGW